MLVAAEMSVMATVFVPASYDTYLLMAVESEDAVDAAITDATMRANERLIMNPTHRHEREASPRRRWPMAGDPRSAASRALGLVPLLRPWFGHRRRTPITGYEARTTCAMFCR